MDKMTFFFFHETRSIHPFRSGRGAAVFFVVTVPDSGELYFICRWRTETTRFVRPTPPNRRRPPQCFNNNNRVRTYVGITRLVYYNSAKNVLRAGLCFFSI